MKTVSAALAQHLAGEVTTIITCWKITRRGGVVLDFTDYVRDLETYGSPIKRQVATRVTRSAARLTLRSTTSTSRACSPSAKTCGAAERLLSLSIHPFSLEHRPCPRPSPPRCGRISIRRRRGCARPGASSAATG